jgi:hypothetical protein
VKIALGQESEGIAIITTASPTPTVHLYIGPAFDASIDVNGGSADVTPMQSAALSRALLISAAERAPNAVERCHLELCAKLITTLFPHAERMTGP